MLHFGRADAECDDNNANAALRELPLLHAHHDTVAAAARIHDGQPQKSRAIRLHENRATPGVLITPHTAGFGPYLDVLGGKASTLPPPKPPTYSNSRLGQYLKVEDARQAAVAKDVARELDASRKALRGAVATSVTRVAGPLLDLGTQMLNPEVAVGLTQTLLRARMDKLAVRNPDFAIDTPEYEEARSLLSQGRMGELDRLLKRFE